MTPDPDELPLPSLPPLADDGEAFAEDGGFELSTDGASLDDETLDLGFDLGDLEEGTSWLGDALAEVDDDDPVQFEPEGGYLDEATAELDMDLGFDERPSTVKDAGDEGIDEPRPASAGNDDEVDLPPLDRTPDRDPREEDLPLH